MDTQKALEPLDDLLAATAADFQVHLDRLHRVREMEDVQAQPDRLPRNATPQKDLLGVLQKEIDSDVTNRTPASDQNNAEKPLSGREQVIKAISQMTLVANNTESTTGAATDKPTKPMSHFGLNLVSFLPKMLSGRRQQRSATTTKMKASVILELEIECSGQEQATMLARDVGRVLNCDPIQSDLDVLLKAKGVKIVGSHVGTVGN